MVKLLVCFYNETWIWNGELELSQNQITFLFLLQGYQKKKHMDDNNVMLGVKFHQLLFCGSAQVLRAKKKRKGEEVNTHINIEKVNRVTHCISFTGKIRKTFPFSIYNKSVTVNPGWEYQQKRVIFPRFLHGFSATIIYKQSQDQVHHSIHFCLN